MLSIFFYVCVCVCVKQCFIESMEHNKEEESIRSGDEYFRKAVKTDLDSKTPRRNARFVVVYGVQTLRL